ncbi:DUF2269 family protein [Caulobacter vibrioides]|uniref:DUF2269 domain-containing protein n=2 Tax=Caulobacter vibrioides TaxID=155892 RepID=Q9A4D8_CAUVC|nr:DUF2269 family protein [Caulobacter vibrioides]YP_002518365.1 conserved hypothetical membrane protein [Caulobacter vibrioides NA1000]AAK24860.1 hypothetical protein CC_2898 [Caulobacter vibrioides CB15]ACL96457.1 conserved hypothetical membrane protein [Caulobacter vibrioides NA1000]ATC29730.1 DUF2269 domain-containing protein [Caulobacter vibrioides]AZH13942.1 DUF2269 family protein [Caulobacter vibrioides]QXZ51251.1 DUF2269 family protein [Caulobacter vibrioides]
MDLYLATKAAHIIGAAVLLGTGAGIAFFMLMAHRTRDPALVAHTARIVVLADFIFTTTAVIAQPITGGALAMMAGFPLNTGWVAMSLALYVVTGLCWLPVVWIQMRLRRLAEAAVVAGEPLPPAYDRLFRVWFVLGFPAFAAVLAIVWLMVAKPVF